MLDRYTFENTLEHASQYWRTLTKDEVKAALGEAVMAMVSFDQRNPHHCYDLFSHCMHTVAESLYGGCRCTGRIRCPEWCGRRFESS